MEELFTSTGLSEAKARETVKNKRVSVNLEKAIERARGHRTDLVPVGALLYHVASKLKPQCSSFVPLLAEYVALGRIDSEARVDAAHDYLLKNHAGGNELDVDRSALDLAVGVGQTVTPEQVEAAVENAVSGAKEELLEKRYRYPLGALMSTVRRSLPPWADGRAVKSELDLQILDLLGPKTEADLAPAPKPEKKDKKKGAAEMPADPKGKRPPVPNTATSNVSNVPNGVDDDESGAATIAELMRTKVHFHAPGENFTADGYVVTDKTKSLLAAHLERTGSRVRTRFPPEPNGLLHIGHAKAININFGYAAAHGGVCFLRYDDTNPEKEEEKFFRGILDVVQWLGYKPYKITHSSDHFNQLYEWAKVLIKKNLAYVCHQRVEDIRGFNPPPSPWRDRPVSESLQLFEDMKNGKYDEGEATLRLKMLLEEGKQDPVAYRIKFARHHRTGDTWCIYPTYDYTHCLCDSLEDITHSLCTKEFQNRRSSYYWLCNAVETYCPVQWEYGRLNVSYTVVSKRKIGKLITSGICSDWDDPRLFTLAALRRRGFPAEAINNFCARMGVTGARMTVDPSMLEAVVRNHLNTSAPRHMVVLDPIKINIVNLVKGISYTIDVADFPNDPKRGSHSVTFGHTIYIERSDFKEIGEKGYRRLTPEQPVGLRHAGYVIRLKTVRSPNELDVECVAVEEASEKPKAFVHWVSDPAKVEVRLYERLFKHKNPEDPAEVPGGFLSDVDPDSKKVVTALANKAIIKNINPFDRFQFERLGFFSVDPDSNEEKAVFNRTVSLKEDAKKA